MKRSTINELLSDAVEFFIKMNCRLPPFAFWTVREWYSHFEEYSGVRDAMLGWDITDFGSGRFSRTGLTLFTLRGGVSGDPRYPRPYIEKLMIVDENQHIPLHFHSGAMEDIVNRGGGNLLVTFYNSLPSGELDTSDLTLFTDGRSVSSSAGATLRLTPGESVTILPGVYHSYFGEPGCGRVLAGKIAAVSDEPASRFYEPASRFPFIDEDELPLYLLISDYATM